MTPKNAVVNKHAVPFKIATLSIPSLLSFFSGEKKSIQKVENNLKSDHVEAFSYQRGVSRGKKIKWRWSLKAGGRLRELTP